MFVAGKRPKAEYIVMNDTDGIPASPNTFKTVSEAKKFIQEFRKRFERQGYYFTSRQERINPKDVELSIQSSWEDVFATDGGKMQAFGQEVVGMGGGRQPFHVPWKQKKERFMRLKDGQIVRNCKIVYYPRGLVEVKRA